MVDSECLKRVSQVYPLYIGIHKYSDAEVVCELCATSQDARARVPTLHELTPVFKGRKCVHGAVTASMDEINGRFAPLVRLRGACATAIAEWDMQWAWWKKVAFISGRRNLRGRSVRVVRLFTSIAPSGSRCGWRGSAILGPYISIG